MSESQTYHVFMEPEDDEHAPNVFIVNANYPQVEDGILYLKADGPGRRIKGAFPIDRVRACMLGTGKYDKSLADKH